MPRIIRLLQTDNIERGQSCHFKLLCNEFPSSVPQETLDRDTGLCMAYRTIVILGSKQEPAACHATHGTGSRWPHRVWGFQFWPCCNIVHAWCRSNPYAQLNVSTSYQLDYPDSQGEWSLHLNCIFFLFPRSSEVLMEKSARMWLSGFTNWLHWDFFFPDHQYESPVTRKT
jgi:hypothetical protein